MGNLRSWLRLGVLMGIPTLLTLAQGEMGSVLVMIFIFGIMLYFGGIRLRIMGGVIAFAVIAIALLYGYMVATGSTNYRLERILSFVNPAMVDEGATYQVNNSKIAIGSGGLYGRGTFVQGAFSQLDYVPEDWTDFIFSTIGEAFGFVGCLGVIAIAILYGYMVASGSDNYRLVRILSFVNPALVDESATYQVNNSKIAIGSGGLWGRGTFVEGAFSQLDYVPEDWTDFIFATIGEAFGFIGSGLVILTYLLIILRMLYLARYTLDRFGQMIIIGVMSMLLFHVFENVGMTVGLMPITGIPLPFLSYGGSNLVTNMAGIGLVLNVVKNRSVTMMPGIAPQTLNMRKWSR